MDSNPFGYSNYLLRKQFWKVFGGTFRIFEPGGSLVFFGSMKAFKLKEDFSIYADEEKTVELLRIKARNIIDISSAYDVYDSKTNEMIGVLKRRGIKSMLKDEWIVMDAWDKEIGMIQEDSWLLAIIRRFITNLVPQKFCCTLGTSPAFQFKQHFNPIIQKMDLDFSVDQSGQLDRRLGIAAAVLLCAIEGRQH